MKNGTTTLEDLQRLLEKQDCQLQAAYRAWASRAEAAQIAVPVAALECFHEACAPPPVSAPGPHTGIRC